MPSGDLGLLAFLLRRARGHHASLTDAPAADAPARISVVTTVLNERKGIRDLLDSIVLQPIPHELVVVDAGSTDGTWEILQRYAARFPHVRPVQFPGRRGAGRNMGVRLATAPYVAFIDGDCIANPFWLERLISGFDAGADVVAGRTVYMGYWAFTNMRRVELPHKNHDTTWPSCNLAYKREAFLGVGGFDERFVTAEDIDLNFRAIDDGSQVKYVAGAVVYAQARDSIIGFLRQAYWNGYGRKQLTLKHGGLWHEYSFGDMIRHQRGFWARARMVAAVWGYLACKRKERRGTYVRSDGSPATHNPTLTLASKDLPSAPGAPTPAPPIPSPLP